MIQPDWKPQPALPLRWWRSAAARGRSRRLYRRWWWKQPGSGAAHCQPRKAGGKSVSISCACPLGRLPLSGSEWLYDGPLDGRRARKQSFVKWLTLAESGMAVYGQSQQETGNHSGSAIARSRPQKEAPSVSPPRCLGPRRCQTRHRNFGFAIHAWNARTCSSTSRLGATHHAMPVALWRIRSQALA